MQTWCRYIPASMLREGVCGEGGRTVGGGAIGGFDGAGGVDLVDGAAELEQLPPWPALDAMPPTCALNRSNRCSS